MQRPTSVSVIGWLAVIFGGMAVLSAVMILTVSLLVPEMRDATPPESSDMPAPFRLMSYVFRYFWVLAVIQLGAATLLISAGVALLKLRAWARTTIEIYACFGLAYNLAFGTFWLWSIASMMKVVPEEAGTAATMSIVMMVFGALMVVGFSIPLIIVIRVLRGATVRTAIAAAN